MLFGAHVQNRANHHRVTLKTGDAVHAIGIPPKTEGRGSSANGGELLFLALATCFCNDIYREAANLGIEVQGVEVEVMGEFAAGQPVLRGAGKSTAPEEDLRHLMAYTDEIAEAQQTVRIETPVKLETVEIIRPPAEGASHYGMGPGWESGPAI